MNSKFLKFVELSGTLINEQADVENLWNQYIDFIKYSRANPTNSFEWNFIGWQIQQQPKPKALFEDCTTQPIEIQKLPHTAPGNGTFYNFSFTNPSTPSATITTPPVLNTPTKEATDILLNQYLNVDQTLEGFDQIDLIPNMTSSQPIASVKNISMLKELHDERQEQQPPAATIVQKKRKRIEITPRQVGRPTLIDTLIKLDGEDDIEVLQLNTKELILPSNSEGQENKRSKTIL
jgi:hypothetical protein